MFLRIGRRWSVVLLFGVCAAPLAGQTTGAVEPLRRADLPIGDRYQTHRTPFAVRLAWEQDSVLVRRAVFALPVRPGTRIRVSSPDAIVTDLVTGPEWSEASNAGMTAPTQPGFYGARIESSKGTIHLNLMVVHPAEGAVDETLLGYRIGSYRPRPRNRSRAYEPPPGFVAVSREHQDVLVSPHITIGELLCKQPGEPRLVYFTPFLIRKLEAVLEEVNARGIAAPRLTLMSGFRTPAYNLSIGNRTYFSRHLWGDAADIFIDADGDGSMDDLNGDGKLDIGDARFLSGLIEGLMLDSPVGVRPGGLASYRPNSAHGGFVHVDARGQQARW